MTILKGRAGTVKKNGVSIAQVQDWKIDSSLDIKDGTCLLDTSKVKLGDLSDWKGTMSLLFDPANTEQLALQTAHLGGNTLTDVEFYVTSAIHYSGDIIITGMGVTVPVGDLVKCAVTFEGSGVLTYNAS
jgi:hypothetical protein